MNVKLAELLADGTPSGEAIDGFIAANGFPLVQESDVTFVFRGHVDEVRLRCWISGLDTAQPLERIDGTDLWAATMELPRGSRIEYKLELIHPGGHRELIIDPLNPVLAEDPFGANSVCQAWGYERPSWTFDDPDALKGSIHQARIASSAFGDARELQVYLPSRYRKNRRYPLLIVHDGADYLRFADLKIVLDNLIHALEIPQLVVALTHSPDRLSEYPGNDRHAAFLAEDVLPFMLDKFPIREGRENRGLMGASFGGVASLHAAWRYPESYGRLLLQSGSFAFSDLGRHRRGPAFDPVVEFMNAFRADPGVPAQRIYMSCGVYESLIYENRSLLPKLQAQGIDVRFEEARDAHNWENWRDRLRSGLTWLFPGPLWMVYE